MIPLRHKPERFRAAASSGTLVRVHPHAMRPSASFEPESPAPPAGRRRRRGTGMLDVAVTVAIVGTAIVAVLGFMGSGTAANGQAADLSTGVRLAKAGHEWAATKPYATVRSLIGAPKVCYSVIDGQGNPMPGYNGWSQEISARRVNTTNLSQDATTASDVLRVTVTARRGGIPVSSLEWLITDQIAATQPAVAP